MARKGGISRKGSNGRFRYYDRKGERITDPEVLARIDALVIPPAWKDVWISPRVRSPLQATGVDAAGRRQYLYHPDYRAQQEQAPNIASRKASQMQPGAASTSTTPISAPSRNRRNTTSSCGSRSGYPSCGRR